MASILDRESLSSFLASPYFNVAVKDQETCTTDNISASFSHVTVAKFLSYHLTIPKGDIDGQYKIYVCFSSRTSLAEMAPYYGPDEPKDIIQLEQFFLAGDVACGIGYGMSNSQLNTGLSNPHHRNPVGIVLFLRDLSLEPEEAKSQVTLPFGIYHFVAFRIDNLRDRPSPHGTAHVCGQQKLSRYFQVHFLFDLGY